MAMVRDVMRAGAERVKKAASAAEKTMEKDQSGPDNMPDLPSIGKRVGKGVRKGLKSIGKKKGKMPAKGGPPKGAASGRFLFKDTP